MSRHAVDESGQMSMSISNFSNFFDCLRLDGSSCLHACAEMMMDHLQRHSSLIAAASAVLCDEWLVTATAQPSPTVLKLGIR